MNLQNFCELPKWPEDIMAKKQHPLGSTNPHRMYVPEYRLAIYNAKNLGEMVDAMYKALSASGYNNWGDASPELAKKCLAKLNEAKHNTQEV